MIALSVDVLIVDDSVVDLRLLMHMMDERELTLAVAQNGFSGFDKARELSPGVILLDVRMPDMDGYQLCRLLKSDTKTRHSPVIFLTAASDLQERLYGFRAGGVDYISKPFSPEEVLARIGVHLDLARRRLGGSGATDERGSGGPVSRGALLVAAAQKELAQHMRSPPKLEDLASSLRTSRRQLSQSFLRFCGMTVFEWVREERWRRAHALVVGTDLSVSVIGEETGFSTPANFTRGFRERFGFSPRELRANVDRGASVIGSNPTPAQRE
jgi:DNA-binding response OmpR family regulator